MIVFHKIRWKNILSTGNIFTEINLTASKNSLIVGTNGSGKCLHPSTKVDVFVDDKDVEHKLNSFLKR